MDAEQRCKRLCPLLSITKSDFFPHNSIKRHKSSKAIAVSKEVVRAPKIRLPLLSLTVRIFFHCTEHALFSLSQSQALLLLHQPSGMKNTRNKISQAEQICMFVVRCVFVQQAVSGLGKYWRMLSNLFLSTGPLWVTPRGERLERKIVETSRTFVLSRMQIFSVYISHPKLLPDGARLLIAKEAGHRKWEEPNSISPITRKWHFQSLLN